MKEKIDPESFYAIVVEKDITPEMLKKTTFKFDKSNSRASDVAVAFNRARNIDSNINQIPSSSTSKIEIVHLSRLSDEKYLNKELVCKDFSIKPLSEAKTCNFDGQITRGIFVRNNLGGTELDSVIHGFKSLSDKFGHHAKLENVFELFGEFEAGAKHVIFTDDAMELENDNDVTIPGKQF